MIKNIFVVICTIFAVFSGITITFGIITKNANDISYLSIGDSIASGYALPLYKKDSIPVKESFAFEFGEKIGAVKIDNIAVSGADTNDTIKMFEDRKTKKLIKNADVITIAIGSNDILSSGMKIVYKTVGVKNSKEMQNAINNTKNSNIQTFFMIDDISKAVKSEEAKETLTESIEKFKQNFITIIERIRNINKKTMIIVESFYNPYKDFVFESAGVKIIDFGDTVQKYIDKMNDFLYTNSYYYKEYYVADISDLDNEKTNVLIDVKNMKFSIDPHPNKEGHNYIFNQTLSVYNKEKGS